MKFPDLPAILAAILLAPILLLAPGYFWSRLADVGGVSHPERAAWSLVLSLATVPVLAYNFFLLFPYNAWTIWAFALLEVAVPGLVLLGRRPLAADTSPVRLAARGKRTLLQICSKVSAHRISNLPSCDSRQLGFRHGLLGGRWWILPALMALLALSCLMDVERGSLLYRGYPAGDYHKHIFVTDAISRTGVHPVNPVFHPGRPLPLFYYFWWHLVCSMVDGLSGWRLSP